MKHPVPHARRPGRRCGSPRAVAAVLALMLLAGCGVRASVSPTPQPTFAPTPTLAPARPLAWQAHPPSPAWQGSASGSGLTPAQDGASAYSCAPDATAQQGAAVWVTRDRAAHWTRMSAVAPGVQLQSCRLIVDGLAPAQAVAIVCPVYQQGGYCPGLVNYLTTDGGATWTKVSGPLQMFMQITTYQGVTYALTGDAPHSHCRCSSALAVSHDGMRTWTRIDHGILDAQRFPTSFSLNPLTHGLLVETSNSYVGQNEVWTSGDTGKTWAESRNPTVDSYVIQSPAVDGSWRVCGYHYSVSSAHPSYPSLLMCSDDSGQTWSEAGGPYTGKLMDPAPVVPIAIARDGSVLAVWRTSDARDDAAPRELRRLPYGAQTWESLGLLPAGVGDAASAGTLQYSPSGETGALWLWAYQYGAQANQPIYTATYP